MLRFRERPVDHWLALAAALVTVVAWASAFVGIRSAGRSRVHRPIAILLGWAILDEAPAAMSLVRGAIALAGVVMVRS